MSNLENKLIHIFVPGPLGGAERVLLAGLPELAKATGLELWLIKETRSPEGFDHFYKLIQDKGIIIKIFESNTPFDIKLIKELRKTISLGYQDSLIHAHGLKASFYSKFLTKNKNIIITHHGNTSHTFKVRMYEKIVERIMKNIACTISVSKQMQKDLSDKSISSELVENLLSINFLDKVENQSDKVKLIVIGRLSQEKGINFLIEALRGLDGFELNILGDGPKREELEKMVQDYGLEKSINFLGFIEDISNFLIQSDCLVMPSLREGMPMTLIEALCCGIPVIGSNVGALSDLVIQNGLLSQAADINHLKENLINFKEKQNQYTHEAQKLKDSFRERFSPQRWAKNTMKVYKRVLEN